MAIGNSADDLPKEVDCHFFGQSPFVVDEGEEVALINIFKNQVTISIISMNVMAIVFLFGVNRTPTSQNDFPKCHIAS